MTAPFAFAGELAALATAGCWTTTSLAFEAAGRRIGSLAVNQIRLLMAFFLLAGYTAITRGQPLPLDASGHAWLWLSLSGLIGFTVGDLCLFRAFVVLGARLSMLLMSLVPPITALIGRFVLGESLGVGDWLAMALTVSGVAWVVSERQPAGQSTQVTTWGVVLGVLGATGQSVGLVLSKYGMGDYDSFAATHIRIIAGIVGFAVVFLVIGWWPKVAAATRDRRAMGFTTLGAVFGPFLGVSLSLVAVKYTATGIAATIMALVPVLIIPAAVVIQKERVTVRGVAGAILAVGGVALLFR